MQAPPLPPMTDDEEAHLIGIVAKLEGLLALTRAGPGGVAQLRRIFIADIAELNAELSLRPRARDQVAPPNAAVPQVPPSQASEATTR